MAASTNSNIALGKIKDDYVLGILCAKTGMTRIARKHMQGWERGGDRRENFKRGLADAAACTLEDIAHELHICRHKNKLLFDRVVCKRFGMRRLDAILDVISRRKSIALVRAKGKVARLIDALLDLPRTMRSDHVSHVEGMALKWGCGAARGKAVES